MRQRLTIVFLMIISFALAAGPCVAETPQEFKVKASYLLNLPMFADWPASTSGYQSFRVCIIGDTPLHDVLETMKGRKIKNRPVAIVPIHEIAQSDGCQVLFIAVTERYRLQRLLPEAHRLGIMTISDIRDFTKHGGMVSLLSINNKITYDLNLVSARSAGISLSSQILKLANDVIN